MAGIFFSCKMGDFLLMDDEKYKLFLKEKQIKYKTIGMIVRSKIIFSKLCNKLYTFQIRAGTW